MLAAFYIGDHKDDGLLARVGYFVIRIGQILEKFGRATHCEAIQDGPWWNCSIIGASRRDGKQVRQKTVRLTPGNWRILSVPAWDLADFNTRAMPLLGTPYSDLGAAASASLLVRFVAWTLRIDVSKKGQWCSRFLGDGGGMHGAEDLSVSELMGHLMNLYGTVDVTDSYFSTPES